MSRRFLTVALLLLSQGSLRSLEAAQEPARPKLPAQADTNDWEAYYDRGAAILHRLPNEADRAFYWASRLNPARAEPPFGRWVAFWLRTGKDWGAYVRGEVRERDREDVRRAEAWRELALYRNPLVHRTLEALIWEQLVPGRWQSDVATRGFLAHAQGRLEEAVQLYARAIALDPEKYAWVRFSRAAALVGLQRYDSAAGELTQLIEHERRTAEASVLPQYESLELLEYSMALLYTARSDARRAREALDRALLENLGFYPARQMLGQLALAAGDVPAAVREYQLAVDVKADDPVMRVDYGLALKRAGRLDDAIEQFRRATELEPYWAEPHLDLAITLDAAGRATDARAAYASFLARAPAGARSQIAHATARLKALAAIETPP